MGTLITKVQFRVDKDGEVFALFPYEPSDIFGYYCNCYTEHGHTEADHQNCIADTVAATMKQYAALHHALTTQHGYNLVVIQKTWGANEARQNAAARWRTGK